MHPKRIAPAVWPLTLTDGSSVELTLIPAARRSVGFRVSADRVIVRAPKQLPRREVLHLIAARHHWISSNVLHLRDQIRSVLPQAPHTLFYLGQAWTVQPDIAYSGVVFSDGWCRVGGTSQTLAAHQVAVDVLAKQAYSVFLARMQRFLLSCPRPPTKLALSNARRRWGSCSAAGVIRLNWRLIQASPEAIDYVIAHELAHLKAMNHAPVFWQELARLLPDFENGQRWLREHAGLCDSIETSCKGLFS